MAVPRFSALEVVFAVLLAVGGVTAIAADKLGNEFAKSIGIAVAFLAAIVFGLKTIVQRRAEIGTRYSSDINPAFHVFRGVGAVAWGVAFVLAGVLFVGAGVASLTPRSDPRDFFTEHSGLFVILGGLAVTAWGIGSAAPATRRHRGTERPAHRRADRVAAIVLIVPTGLAIVVWGLLMTLAPAPASAIKGAARHWIETLVR